MQTLVVYGEHSAHLALGHLVHALAASHKHAHGHIVSHVHRVLVMAEEVGPLVIVSGGAQLSTNICLHIFGDILFLVVKSENMHNHVRRILGVDETEIN